MSRRCCGLLGLVAAATLAAPASAAPEVSPQDFAFGLPIIIPKEASAYRFALPLDVYRGTARDDLGDVRVFNAQGEAVPYSLLRPPAPAQTHGAVTVLPLFPLRAGARATLDGDRLITDAPAASGDGRLRGGGAANTAVNQYILDGRTFGSAVVALQLNWPETTADYSGRVKIESSDDVESWQTLVAAAPTANLHANGQSLVESRVALPPTQAKFWRISWVGPPPRFELTSVSAEPAGSTGEALRTGLDVAGGANSAEPDADIFDLGAHLPVSRVNVTLPETNTVNTIELSSRRAPADPWRTVTQAGFYRLNTPEGEQRNAPIDILIDRDRYWRARIVRGGGLPRTPLGLHLEWVPNEVTFLARGQAPFLLAYGNSAATGAEVDLSQVPPDLEIATAAIGVARVLGGASQLNVTAATYSRARVVLWGAVLIVVVLAVWLALRFSKAR